MYTMVSVASVVAPPPPSNSLLRSTDLTRVWAIIPRNAFLEFPAAAMVGDVLGLPKDSWAAAAAAVLILGWPFILFALYVSLIVLYPNKRSGSDFEKLSH